jgi:hypothetical protein
MSPSLIGVALMWSVSLGLRQTLGVFLPADCYFLLVPTPENTGVFDAMCSYNRVLQDGVCVGLLAGLVKMATAFMSTLPPACPQRVARLTGFLKLRPEAQCLGC